MLGPTVTKIVMVISLAIFSSLLEGLAFTLVKIRTFIKN